jgi:hypothetical protein
VVDPSLPPWLLTFGQVRRGPAVDWAIVADADIWPRLSTRDRAEAVSDRVRIVLSCARDHAITIRPSDVVSATNGDFEAWQKLNRDPKADDWWQDMKGSSLLPCGLLFASRSDLTQAECADRDYLREKWDEIERRRRDLRFAGALTALVPGDPVEAEQAERHRLAQLQQLAEEERDVVAALQKYSVMPRRSLTESAQAGSTRTGARSASDQLQDARKTTRGGPSVGLDSHRSEQARDAAENTVRATAIPERKAGRPGRPPGNGVFRSDEDARETLTRAVRALTTPHKQATKDAVRLWLRKNESGRGDVSEAAIDYWVKEKLGYPDWPSFRDGVQ